MMPRGMNRLGRLLAVRRGEGRLTVLVAALFGTIEAGRGFGEIGADTLLLSRYGAEVLPFLYVGLGLLSLVVAVAYGAALGRFRRRPLFAVLLGGFAFLLVAERAGVMGGATGILPALWLTVYVIGAILGTVVWTVAGSVLDVRQAKRLFPICTSAGILGGFAGTLAAGPLARLVGVENLLLVYAGLLVAAAGLAAEVIARFGRGTQVRPVQRALATELRAGFDYVRRSPLMRLIAVAYVLFAVLYFSISFPFLRVLSGAFTSEADLATALGFISAGVTAASFLVSLVIANRLYARLGVATVALLLPLVYLAGFALWLVQFSLATAVAVRVAQQVTQRGISNAVWGAFFNVVPAERRAQVLAFVDGVPGQLGIALSGVLLLVAGGMATISIFLLGIAAAIACTWVVVQIRRRYAESLLGTLRAGLAEQVLEGGPGLDSLRRDPDVVAALGAALGDPSPGVRCLAAEMLGRLGAPEGTAGLAALLADPDPTVRAAALRSLGSVGPGAWSAGTLGAALRDPDSRVRVAAVEAASRVDGEVLASASSLLATDPSPAVRAELSVALVRAGEEERPHGLLAALLDAATPEERVAGLEAVGRLGGHAPSASIETYLGDPSPEVRAAAVRAVAVVTEGIDDPLPALGRALDDDATVVRRAAARALNGRAGATAVALDALATGSDRAQGAAILALDGHGDEVREPLLEWSLGQVDRAASLRRRAMALGAGDSDGDGVASSLDFLRALLERRGVEIEERLLGALAVLGAPEASGLLRRCLRSNDPETRAQALEALDSLGDRRLGRAIAALLEIDPDDRRSDPLQVMRSLVDDRDPWVRALALRGLSEQLATELRMIVDRAMDDQDPIVRAAAGRTAHAGAPDMPETARTLDEIERMLFLRRVPLFGDLAPEDLQRLATTATEHFYPAGEAIVREGELGDALVVIVEGSVRVVREEAEGTRLLRTYQAGDHFGELAVLRERPRAATVIAEAGGMRGLVIAGEGLKAILTERPEAAMAMLATLAERISTQ